MQFFIGLILGAALLALIIWLHRNHIIVKWYEWFMGGLGFLLLLWAVHDFFASMAEYNEHAARTLLWMLGTPAVVLLAIAFFLPFWRHIKKLRDDPLLQKKATAK